jgi:maltose O-acetyltransferase
MSRASIIRKILNKIRNLFAEDDFNEAKEMEKIIEGYRKRGIEIGANTYIGGVIFGADGRDPITIGNDCVLTRCTILGHDASPAMFIPELQGTGLFDRISVTRRTVIKDQCFIGVNAIVLCGVTIGPRSIVGAGAVVTQDVAPGTVVAGNPAKVMCTIEEFIEKHKRQMQEYPEFYPGLPPRKT